MSLDKEHFEGLADKCVWYVATELSRPIMARKHDRPDKVPHPEWRAVIQSQKSAATIKISEMSNMQLLDLIGKVLADA